MCRWGRRLFGLTTGFGNTVMAVFFPLMGLMRFGSPPSGGGLTARAFSESAKQASTVSRMKTKGFLKIGLSKRWMDAIFI
jgi:hypothetical protein